MDEAIKPSLNMLTDGEQETERRFCSVWDLLGITIDILMK